MKGSKDPTLLFFLDAEKAFDRLEWLFLKQVVEKMNFSPIFQHWVNLIYDKQTTKVVIDGQDSEKISIARGRYQLPGECGN